jgi:hypothetical protein
MQQKSYIRITFAGVFLKEAQGIKIIIKGEKI